MLSSLAPLSPLHVDCPRVFNPSNKHTTTNQFTILFPFTSSPALSLSHSLSLPRLPCHSSHSLLTVSPHRLSLHIITIFLSLSLPLSPHRLSSPSLLTVSLLHSPSLTQSLHRLPLSRTLSSPSLTPSSSSLSLPHTVLRSTPSAYRIKISQLRIPFRTTHSRRSQSSKRAMSTRSCPGPLPGI